MCQMLLALLTLLWLCVATVVLASCRLAARADARATRAFPEAGTL